MPHEEHRRHRHRRIRRVKALLRYMPRRAVFHRYPFIGRFAAFARKQPYLWSFKASNLTRAYYAGSILSLLPVMGIQLPTALLLAVLLRTNLMVLGGLQFISNPATVWIYGGTWWVGATVIESTGFGVDPTPAETEGPATVAAPDHTDLATPTTTTQLRHWTRTVGTSINALVLGGVLCGTLLGAILDLVTRLIAGRGHLHPRPKTPPPGFDSTAPPVP